MPGHTSISKHEVFTVRETHYFDKQGNLNRIKVHADGIDNFYNTANPDVVLSGHFMVNFEVDLRDRGVPAGYRRTVPYHRSWLWHGLGCKLAGG